MEKPSPVHGKGEAREKPSPGGGGELLPAPPKRLLLLDAGDPPPVKNEPRETVPSDADLQSLLQEVARRGCLKYCLSPDNRQGSDFQKREWLGDSVHVPSFSSFFPSYVASLP
jgi:hypothetical protein